MSGYVADRGVKLRYTSMVLVCGQRTVFSWNACCVFILKARGYASMQAAHRSAWCWSIYIFLAYQMFTVMEACLVVTILYYYLP